MSVAVRDARPGDGVRLAAMWREHAAYYAERFPGDFVVPREEGLAEWFEADLARERSPEMRWGRERGATFARATTYHASEVSIPFWEERAGYTRRGVTFAKRLA